MALPPAPHVARCKRRAAGALPLEGLVPGFFSRSAVFRIAFLQAQPQQLGAHVCKACGSNLHARESHQHGRQTLAKQRRGSGMVSRRNFEDFFPRWSRLGCQKSSDLYHVNAVQCSSKSHKVCIQELCYWMQGRRPGLQASMKDAAMDTCLLVCSESGHSA